MKPWRRRTVKGLIVLGSLLAFLSVFAIWVERQALDTGEWVNTSGHLIRNQTIRTALADYMVEQLYENVDVEKKVEEVLPGETKELAGPAASGLRQIAAPDLASYMPDFKPYLGECRFHNCSHRHEPGCAVLTAVEAGAISPSRYRIYDELWDELSAPPKY